MKAILTYIKPVDGKQEELTRLFDTEKATKVCDIENTFGKKAQEIYITKKGTIFIRNINKDKLDVADQKEVKAWIGENEPEKYIKFFGEVEEG